jgi:aquaporin Z
VVITHAGVAITFGLVVMVMIYALGSISSAHMNPAVTIAFTLAGRFNIKQVLPYIEGQLLGINYKTHNHAHSSLK